MSKDFSKNTNSQKNQEYNPGVQEELSAELGNESELSMSELDNIVGGKNTLQSEPEPFPGSNRRFVRGSRNGDGSYVWVGKN